SEPDDFELFYDDKNILSTMPGISKSSTARSAWPFGNSSKLAISREAFNDLQLKYMDILFAQGCDKETPQFRHYALWLIPEFQPQMSKFVELYGVYHITLFSAWPMDHQPDLSGLIPQGHQPWRPTNAEVVVKNSLVLLEFDTASLNRVLDKIVNARIWPASKRTTSLHLTLGDLDSGIVAPPDKIKELLVKDNRWVVQLIEKVKLKSSQIDSHDNYEYQFVRGNNWTLYNI
ncbi:hypothetical protein KDA11_01055, partial [Candidatus Saccharibacteria bacterium]|nr:hypothetical protein [Candidatus Saccharibacteria bacterium]